MIHQASVDQFRNKSIPRENSLLVLAMRHYPRGLKKELSDEFRNILAPAPELFKEWKTFEKESGHEEAFRLSHYEERFALSPIGLFLLKKYSEESAAKNIYLACQCQIGERCHREMLLLIAKNKYGATVGPIHNTYPTFEKRIGDLDDSIKLW